MYLLISSLLFVTAWILAALGVPRAPTWFYVLVWYPTLGILDAIVARRTRASPLIRDPGRALSLLAWSAPIWLIFEAANFRLQNWYYVLLPAASWERWTGILLSFATVMPAIVLMERLLESFGVGARWRGRPVHVGDKHPEIAALAGGVLLLVTLAWPRLFFPLIWGAAWLLAEPILYRKRPQLSLFRDIARGEWGRIGRLFLAGLIIGVLWETYNHWARARWIYTVPGLDQLKWFEMPPLGFVGFPFFALEAWSIYHVLCAAGAAHPAHYRSVLSRNRVGLAWAVAAVFIVATLAGLERWTISSVEPGPIPGHERRAVSVWELARNDPQRVATQLEVGLDSARALIDWAGLVTLRGIGVEHTEELNRLGVNGVCDLAHQSPDALWPRLRQDAQLRRWRPTRPEVHVWVTAARRSCEGRARD